MKVEAPWTQEQVDALNRWQTCGWVHPFTCNSDQDRMNAAHRAHVAEYGGDFGQLVAYQSGWVCPVCAYRQSWAHDFMFNDPPKMPLSFFATPKPDE